jgi:glycosyltransferase involved in cell wall biosynthesis
VDQLPLVSIVTPTYNQAQYLEETIKSVLSQDYPHIEYIVLDDGSTDSTPHILDRYTGRIQWESHPNMGQTRTVNKAWLMCRGDILSWINSDDTFLPGAVSTAVDYLLSHPDVLMMYGDYYEIDSQSRLRRYVQTREFDYIEMVRECYCMPGAGIFLRRQALEMAGLLDARLDYIMDFGYWLRLGLVGKIEHVSHYFAQYRVHPAIKSRTPSPKKAEEYIQVYDELFKQNDLPETLKAIQAEALSNAYIFAALHHFNRGDGQQTRTHLIHCLRLYPRNISWLVIALLLGSFMGGDGIRWMTSTWRMMRA